MSTSTITTQKKRPSNGKTVNTRHLSFLELGKESERYQRKTLSIEVDTIITGSFRQLKYEPIGYLTPGVTLQPEYCRFAMRLQPYARHMLDYLIFFAMDTATNLARWNHQTQRSLAKYLKLGDIAYTQETIRKGIGILRNHNALVNKEYGTYMINPLIHASKGRRRELFKAYNILLERKGKRKIIDLYPI